MSKKRNRSSSKMTSSMLVMIGKVTHLNGDLNKPTIVTTFAGLGCLGAFAGCACCLCKGKWGTTGGLLITSVGLGCAYHYLYKKDMKEKTRDYAHEERISMIKHPNSPIEGEEESHEASKDGLKYNLYKPSEAFNEGNNLTPLLGYLLPEGFDALVYGMKGSMKSYFVIDIMAQIVRGEVPSVLPHKMTDYKILQNIYCIYADGENGKAITKDRLSFFGNTLDSHMDILEAREFGDDLESFFKVLHEICMSKPVGSKILVGLDNLKSLLNDMSHSQGKDYFNHLKKLRNALKEKDISLTSFTVHHTVKTGDKISGSYNLPCLLPYVFRLEKGKDKAHKNWVIENTRHGDHKDSVYALKVVTEDYTHLVYDYTLNDTSISDATSEKEERHQKYEQVKAMRESEPPLTWKEIVSLTGVTQQCYNNWKKEFAE